MLLVVWLALSSPTASAAPAPPGCVAATSSSTILANVTGAAAAYEALDQTAFNASIKLAREALPCLGEVLSNTTAASYARVEGLAAQLAGDKPARQRWFRAAIALDPEGDLGPVIAPPDHPLRRAWDEARATPAGERVEIGAPEGLTARVDGKVSSTAPADRPALVQLVSPTDPDQAGDRVLWTSFSWPCPAMPTAAMLGLPPKLVAQAPPRARSWGPRQTALLGAGASLIAGAGMYGLALASRQDFDDPLSAEIQDEADVEAAARRVNGMVWASAGLGLLGVGVGATAMVVLEF